jgi:hypothetical protein
MGYSGYGGSTYCSPSLKCCPSSPETCPRTSSPCSWALWLQRTEPCITVLLIQWGNFSVSPNVLLPSGLSGSAKGAQHTQKTGPVPEPGVEGGIHGCIQNLWFTPNKHFLCHHVYLFWSLLSVSEPQMWSFLESHLLEFTSFLKQRK